jgi:hypothetical protein
MKPALALAAATVALAAAVTAQAGLPFKMANRAAFETGMRTFFVAAEKRDAHERYRVRSIGCAKAGIGRWGCIVVASGRTGIQTFSLTLSCPSDKPVPSCGYRIDAVRMP